MTPGRDHWWHELVDAPARRGGDRAHVGRRPADDHLHFGHDRQAQGRGPHPLRLSDQGRAGPAHGFDLKPDDVLYWITDMGWMMGPWEVWGSAAARRKLAAVRRRAGLPGRRPPVGAGRAARRDRAGRLADADPQPAPARRRSRSGDTTCRRCAGSARPARRGIPSPGRGCSRSSADRRLPILNYSGGTEISGGILLGNLLTPLKPAAFSGACARHGGRRAGRGRATACAAGRRARWASWRSGSRGSG